MKFYGKEGRTTTLTLATKLPLTGEMFARTVRMPGQTLLKYQNRTFRDLLDEHLKDPLLKAYFSMLCVGIATPPAELSAVIAGVFFVHALRTMWMPRGGFGKVAETLAEVFQEHGGTRGRSGAAAA